MNYQEAIQCVCTAASQPLAPPPPASPFWSNPANIISGTAALGTIGAAIAAFIAIFFTGYQIRLSRRALGFQLLLTLEDKFNSIEGKKARLKAVNALQNDADKSDIHDMLMFFEKIGLLVHQGALEPELVWNTFYFWVRPFSALSSEYVEKLRATDNDTTYWSEFSFLKECLDKIEIKKRGQKEPTPLSDDDKQTFFAMET
jgi:hypothetical protein